MKTYQARIHFKSNKLDYEFLILFSGRKSIWWILNPNYALPIDMLMKKVEESYNYNGKVRNKLNIIATP